MKRSRIIVLDEVGANIDVRTDKLIQQTLRSETGLFADATVITIAHRLGTVMDYDRILVLDKGTLVEFGRPHELLARGPNKGWLAKMVNDMGPEGEAQMKEIALKKEQERLMWETRNGDGEPVPSVQKFGTRTRIVDRPQEGAQLNRNEDFNMFSIPIRAGYALPPGINAVADSNEYADEDFDAEAHGAL
jgi:ABC-type multidrug transport system ATPase subunit